MSACGERSSTAVLHGTAGVSAEAHTPIFPVVRPEEAIASSGSIVLS